VDATFKTNVRICSTCATKTDETGRYCPECGAVLVELAALADTGLAASVSRDAADSLVGTTVDQFALDGVLGGGAFGTVYRGRQLGLDRAVAIKVPTRMIASEPVMAKRFAREARAAARISHPGVVAIYAVGELDDQRPYMAMQLVDGEPLDRILELGPLAPARALRIARQIASALAETHAVDVVHRDLKPSNIIWRRDRSGDDRITIVDFGIAVCRFGSADATRLTADGLVGTPHYMSPEQAHGDEVDARADLYALGCVLFELVTNTTPFDGSGFEVLLAHMGRDVPAPSSRHADVPEAIDRLVAKLTRKKPADRPASADEVVALLDDALAEIGDAPVASLPRARRASTDRARHASTERSRRAFGGSIASSASEAGDHARRATPANRSLPTRRDLPSRSAIAGARGWIIAAACAVAIAGGTIAGYRIGASSRGAATASGGERPDPQQRREFVDDDGDTLMRVVVPDPIAAGAETFAHLKLANKLGQPVVASQIVVTITSPGGDARGLVAAPRAERGHYELHYAFPTSGRYVVRVFPPTGPDAAFEFSIDVR
jgi:serine/threonine-protein kinase